METWWILFIYNISLIYKVNKGIKVGGEGSIESLLRFRDE